MKSKAMKALGHSGCHDCSPKAWHDVANVTGDYDLDATIQHRSNSDMPHRLNLYTKRNSYGHKSGYSGYHNYSGDD